MVAKGSVWVSWRADRGKWEVGYYFQGDQYRHYSWEIGGERRSFTKDNEHWAMALRDFIYARLVPINGICTFHPGQVRSGKPRGKFQVGKYAEIWLEEYRVLSVGTGRVKHQRYQELCRFNRQFWTVKLGELDVFEINEPVLKEFYVWLVDQGIKRTYCQSVMIGFKMFLSSVLKNTPFKLPPFPAYEVRPADRAGMAWLTEQEQDRVIERVRAKHRPIVVMMMYHGLRNTEARHLKRSDLKGDYLTVRTAKGGLDRVICIEPELLDIIKGIPPAVNDLLFHFRGGLYDRTTLWQLIRTALDRAGFNSMTPAQATRHSFASQRNAKGEPTRMIQYEMGHRAIRTTEIYTHVRPEDLRQWGRG